MPPTASHGAVNSSQNLLLTGPTMHGISQAITSHDLLNGLAVKSTTPASGDVTLNRLQSTDVWMWKIMWLFLVHNGFSSQRTM